MYELSQHLKPQPRDCPSRHSSVLCRAWWWQAVEFWQWDHGLCCSLCAVLCLCVCTRGPVRWPCFWWCVDVAHPGFTSCLCLSLVFWEQHSGTGNDDVLFPSQFPPFPVHQDMQFVGRQGSAVPGCHKPVLRAGLVCHVWESAL